MTVSVERNGPPSVRIITGADISSASFTAMKMVADIMVRIIGSSIENSILRLPAPSSSAASSTSRSIDLNPESMSM